MSNSFLNLHTHIFSNHPNMIDVYNQDIENFRENVPFYSIGIHPWHIEESKINSHFSIVENKLNTQNNVAIGECGLDKRIKTPIDLQIAVFESHLRLAEQYHKPVIIHCVAAFQEIIEIKKRLKLTIPLIIHGFSKNSLIANLLLKHGFYLSFGKQLLLNPKMESVFQNIPKNRLFLETDSADISIQEVYAVASAYSKISVEMLQKQIITNFKDAFRKELF